MTTQQTNDNNLQSSNLASTSTTTLNKSDTTIDRGRGEYNESLSRKYNGADMYFNNKDIRNIKSHFSPNK